MDQILKKQSITQVIVLDLSLGRERLRRLTRLCEDENIRLLALDDSDNYFNHTTTMFEDDGLRVIGLREEPLENPTSRFTKRAMDVAVALPVVILVLPVVHALVWLIQRWQSPGPVLFQQERIGMMGQEFTMFKYRTMHANHGRNPQASKADDRIFSAGRWMRRLSIDELPQFIYVLKGDMSVVGPRPHLGQHEELWVRAMRKYVDLAFHPPRHHRLCPGQGLRGEIHSAQHINWS